jgi:hypothetical protein
MTATDWLPILIKAVSTGVLVVSASALAEALGPFWGAVIASLPVSAGPAYVFLAMQHDGKFVAASALSSCAANAATGLFLTVYATVARRAPRWRALGAAVAAWLLASLATRQVTWTPTTALLLNLAVYGIGFVLLRGLATAAGRPSVVAKKYWLELMVRAVAVAGFVSVVVVTSSMLGPQATGIATVFPISLISLIIILQPRIGSSASALLAATALRSMLGFGVMLLVLYLAIGPWGTAWGLGVALLVSIAWSGGLLALRGFGTRVRAGSPWAGKKHSGTAD